MLNNSILELAVKEARKSDHRHKMGAVIFNHKSIISSGRNYSCRSVKHCHPRFFRWKGSLHAEMDAIIKAKRDLDGYSILIIRVNNLGNLMFAMPCDHCMAYLLYTGLKYCYYSDEDRICRMKL